MLDGGQYRLAANNPLVNELLLKDSPPEGYELLTNLVFGPSGNVYARLYEVSHDPVRAD